MSTPEQVKGDSLRRQLEHSERYAAEHGLDLVQDFILQDLGVSAYKGKNAKSGALGKFLAAVEDGTIAPGSYLLVESLDRLSRQEIGKALDQFLAIIRAGIVLVTLADGHVYRANAGLMDLIYSILIMSRSNEESVIKSHRVGAAWSNKRKNVDKVKLTARCPAWLKLSADRTTFTVIPERKAIIERIFDEAIAGIGVYSIARRFNLEGIPPFVSRNGWQKSSVNKILTSRAVIGEFQPHRLVDGKRVPEGAPIANYFPAIISHETFLAAQSWMSQRRTRGGGRRGSFISNLFSKIARCHYCRGPMRYENKGAGPKGGKFLVCDTALRGLGCRAVRWKYDELEASLLSFVEELDLGSFFTSSKDAIERAELQSKIASLEVAVRQAEIERDNAYSLLKIEGVDVSFVAKQLRLCEQQLVISRDELLRSEEALRTRTATASNYAESRESLKGLIAQVSDRSSPDAYKLRAQIAVRLQSVVKNLTLAPAGSLPMSELMDTRLAERDAFLKSEIVLTDQGIAGRYFVVSFRDGSFRAVYPADADALLFDRQIINRTGGFGRVFLLNALGENEVLLGH